MIFFHSHPARLVAKTSLAVARRGVCAALLCGGWVVPAGYALDFRLHTITVQEDGLNSDHSCFQLDPATNVNIDPPQGWSVTSNETSITVASRNASSVEFRIEKSTLAPDVPFKDKGLEVYRRFVTTIVPQGATNMRVLEEKESPLPVFGWIDYEIVTTYDLFGQALKRSTIFININAKVQLALTIIAPEAAYAATRKSAFEMMRSWYPQAAK